MLRQHFDDFFVADGVVEVVAQFGGKGFEGCALCFIGRVFQNGVDAVDMGTSNFGNVDCPVFPMVAVAAFFDDFGVEGAFDFTDFELEGFLYGRGGVGCTDCVAAARALAGFVAFALFFCFRGDFVGNGDNFHFLGVFAVELQLVNHRVKAIVVRAQGVEYLPDDAVVFVFVQCVFGFYTRGDNDGQDNVALLFAFGTAHNAADRLHDIDLGIARGEE